MARNVDARQLQLETPVPEPPPTPTPTPDERANGRTGPPQNRASDRSSAVELLRTPDALLTRSHLRALGLERRAIDAVFRALPVVALPGYSRPLVRADDYVQLIERNTYRDDRVRSCRA